MDDFRAIYRILKTLSDAIDADGFDPARLSAEELGVAPRRLNALLVMLAENGYVDGVEAVRYSSSADPWPHARVGAPRITLKGLEYLHENGVMRKCANVALGIADKLL